MGFRRGTTIRSIAIEGYATGPPAPTYRRERTLPHWPAGDSVLSLLACEDVVESVKVPPVVEVRARCMTI